jgi:hypothetical protein
MTSTTGDLLDKRRTARVAASLGLAAAVAIAACGGGGSSSGDGAAPAPPATAELPQPTAVGTPAGPAVTRVIGAAGGSLNSGDGALLLTIPAGALAGDTVISIQPVTNFAKNGIGSAYRLTPEGTTFAQPVRLAFAYDDASVAGSAPEALEIATQDATGRWRMAASVTRDFAAKTVTASASHFSDWSSVQGLQLRPAKATVNVGGVQDLVLSSCTQVTAAVGDDDLQFPLYDCENDLLEAPDFSSNWAVNGAPGGTTGLGLVVQIGGGGRYSAPATVPKPNIVAVSAEVNDTRYGKLIVSSNITIAGGGYAGTIDIPAGDSSGSFGAQHVEVTWTRADPDPLAGTGGATYYGTAGFWTTLVTPGSTCEAQTVTLDLSARAGKPDSVLEVFSGGPGGGGTYRFNIATQPKTVSFNCSGVPFATLIGWDITAGVCESRGSGTGAGAVPYTDVNNLFGFADPVGTGSPPGCPPNTDATWKFTPH